MSALTSLLARDRIVPVSKIEEALQHQVLAGGDIETILLEMDLVPEDVLAAYRAALFNLLPATREETMRAPREAIRTLRRDLARGAGAIPLQLEGRTVVLAVVEPLSPFVRQQIVTAAGCEVSQRIVTRPRLAAALAHHYGFDLEPRMRRLTDALRRREPGVIRYVRPPSPSLRPSVASPVATGVYSPNPFDQRPDTLEYPVVGLYGAAEQEAPPGISFSEPALPDPVAPEDRSGLVLPPAPKAVPETLSGRIRLSTMPPSNVSASIARATLGPLYAERVRELLAQAAQRDDVLLLLLRFAQQFFDFVGVFSVGKEGARGRMAHGAGLSSERMERIVISLEGSGLVARAVRDRRALVGDLDANDEERAAAALLGRPAGRPGLAVPIVMGSRAVLVVYVDRAGAPLSTEDANDLWALSEPVAEALRRIILEQKAVRHSAPPPAQDSALLGGDISFLTALPAAPRQVVALVQPVSPEPAAISAPAPMVAFESAPAPPAKLPEMRVAVPEPAEQDDDAETETPTDEPIPGEHAADRGRGLAAVDLDRFFRSPERRPSTPREAAVDPEPGAGRGMEDAMRARLQGVPRAAPPPPTRDSLVSTAVSGRADGSYHYASPSGSILEENTRPKRSPAQGPREVQEGLVPTAAPGASFAQVKPRRVEMLKSPATAGVGQGAGPADFVPAPAQAVATPAEGHPVPARGSVANVPQVAAPSVIIDMGDQVAELVDGLLQAGPDDAPAEIGELVQFGEAALPVLLQRFPGPLWFDRRQPYKHRPPGRDVSAVARAIVAFGERAAPYLASKVQSTDADTCFYALMVAGELPHLDLLDAVARRVLDPDASIRGLATEVLRAFDFLPAFVTVLSAFCQLAERPGKDSRRQRLAVEALGELRDRRVLNALLPRLLDPSEAIVQAAHRALALLTCQDFGLAQRKWETWADQWGSAHRVEWLVESLLHPEEGIRTRAGEELKHATQQYFGYHPQLPKRDRELAQRKYREWWEREGRSAFGLS